jgi:hypothetical protein
MTSLLDPTPFAPGFAGKKVKAANYGNGRWLSNTKASR